LEAYDKAQGQSGLFRLPTVHFIVHGDFFFLKEISLHDKRDRVIERYRLEITPEKELQLVLLGTNEDRGNEDKWRWVWAVAGVFLSAFTVWAGWKILLRGQHQTTSLETGPNA
jgi:hypothetical protein